jgi:hypothetical protein
MNDVALFETAMRAAVRVEPDPGLAARLVPRLAETARAATIEAETRASRRRPHSRLGLFARVGTAVAAIPLLLAGLAFAGVTVPGPARDAFDSVGIELPNQPSDHASSQATSNGSGTESTTNPASDGVSGEGNSTAAHQHALQQRGKAKGRALGHTRGKAIGLHEAVPPGLSGDTGPPAHANVGGAPQSNSAPVGHPGPPHPPRGRTGAHGH